MDLNQTFKAKINSPVTSLEKDINAVDTVIELKDGSALPDASNLATLGLSVDAETIFYAKKEGNILSEVLRAFQGESKAWEKEITAVARLFTAYDLDIANENTKLVFDDFNLHKADNLPHKFKDISQDKEYNYGFIIEDNQVYFIAKLGDN